MVLARQELRGGGAVRRHRDMQSGLNVSEAVLECLYSTPAVLCVCACVCAHPLPLACTVARTARLEIKDVVGGVGAQTAERAAGVLRNEDLPWERRDHGLFVGYAPYDKPRYACAVVVEHGGSGSRAAAPIARDILLQAQYGGPPPLEAYPSGIRDQIAEQQRRINARIPPGAQGRSRV